MDQNTFTAGFARCDITPRNGGIPLAGYGATHLRLGAEVQNRLYAHIVCFGHGKTPELLHITVDLIGGQTDLIRDAVTEATGFPRERILVGGTHTHSAPDAGSDMDSIKVYKEFLAKQVAEAVPFAIADLKPARIFYGSEEVGHPGSRMNFCRHYKIVKNSAGSNFGNESIEYCGDNFNDHHASDKENYHYIGHFQDVDPNLCVLKLARENADDILMINFQAHAHITGGSKKSRISSDFPGTTVQKTEALIPNVKCTYIQGACGNINPNTRMIEDGLPGLTFGATRDVEGYGAVLASYVKRIVDRMQESTDQTFKVAQKTISLKCDHSMDSRVEDAEKLVDEFEKTGITPELRAKILEQGFNSIYHCTATLRKVKAEETAPIEINGIRLGEASIAVTPGELFNDLGVYVKTNSPFKFTLFNGYCGAGGTYFPSKGAPAGAYERTSGRFEAGEGEKLAEALVELLYTLKD